MSNRVYLCCTHFSHPPGEQEWPAFADESGTEYEAAYCIPLFWLCLFGPQDIQLALVEDEDADAPRSYAFLACPREDGLARLKARSSVLRRSLGAERHELYLEWAARLGRESYSHILVRTVELDMMEEEGQLQQDMLAALSDLEAACASGALVVSPVLANLAGFPNPPELRRYNSNVLAGTAISAEGWPPALPEPAPKLEQDSVDMAATRRAWWKFW